MSSPVYPLPPLRLPTAGAHAPPDGEYNPISQHSRGLSLTSTHDQAGNPASMTLSSSLLPSYGLRKSFSVDSFVQYGRDNSLLTNPLSNGVYDSPGVAPPQGLVFDVSSRDNEPFRSPSQFRGEGIAQTSEKSTLRFIGDSDIERSDPLNRLFDGGRHVNGQGKNRLVVKAGDLPLPSRTPTLSMTSMSTTSSISVDHVPRQKGAPSVQTMAHRGTNPYAGTTPGRTRSGSLGVYVNQSGKSALVNSQALMYDTWHQNTEVTLVVVGAPSCGKSTVIHKGLKSYGLTDPTPFTMPAGTSDIYMSTRYTRRIGRISHNEIAPDCALHILEVEALPCGKQPSKNKVFWPTGAPRVDGVIICYDASDQLSFVPVEALLQGYHALKLPTVVLACKSDLAREVDPQKAIEVLQVYDVGLVEVANIHEGKEKMRRSFDWLLRSIFRERRSARNESDTHYRNPASPDVLISSPWEKYRISATAVSSMTSARPTLLRQPHMPVPSMPRPAPIPHSPTRVRSTGDLLSEHERSKNHDRQLESDTSGSNCMIHIPSSTMMLHRATPSIGGSTSGFCEREDHNEKTDARSTPWASLEELLDKLIFLAVSGDDPVFISHFLLTYRRFASPRAVLLAMQKRMRQFDTLSGDPMFACFAQMRICLLLELWIRDYPYDFAVRGTAGALSALVKSIIAKTHLLHYGSDFLPFLEFLPNLIDKDALWALKPEDIADESDDSYSPCDDDDDSTPTNDVEQHHSDLFPTTKAMKSLPDVGSSREHKSSLIDTKVLVTPHTTTPQLCTSDSPELPTKSFCRELIKIAQEVNATDSDEIAQEITKMEAKMFLDIEPRHWLHYCFVSGKKDPRTDLIARFNDISNHLADWVVSLILCHDKPKSRAKQIEKFVDIAQKLRSLNNYSALRAFVAGINNSTFPGDETMEIFKAKAPDQAKNLQSWDLLLQRIRSHRAYRMALKNSKGACIPALEVHVSDLIGAHEGNPDGNPNDLKEIHWGKFNIMGKFIGGITQCQVQCRNTTDYAFIERPRIRNLIMKNCIMSDDMQKSRIAPPEVSEGLEDVYRAPFPRPVAREANNQHAKDPLLRKFIFW